MATGGERAGYVQQPSATSALSDSRLWYTYLAAFMLPSTSRRASSAALARSLSSKAMCLRINSSFTDTFLVESLLLPCSFVLSSTADGISLITPVVVQLCLLMPSFTEPPLRCFGIVDAEAEGERCPREEFGFELAGVESSLFEVESFTCRRVTFPLSLRISSMSWTPSGALGFLSLM